MALPDNDNAAVTVGGGAHVERLACHASLPLVAGLDSQRPAVHIWECGSAGLQELAVIHADAAEYEPEAWTRMDRTPTVAWHPREPRLLVTGEVGLRQWSPSGLSVLDGTPSGAAYRYVAFSPDGSTVWAFPSTGGQGEAWRSSDVLDLRSGTLRPGPPWDTGIAEHPGGDLVLTLGSEQGATLGLFARVEGVPARMRVLRRALILDVDFYQTPVFHPDGRYFAIRGNAYENTLDVFEFPSLRRVLHVTLGDPYPGYSPTDAWLEQMSSWSRHNLAFARRSGALLVGTPQGTIVEVDLDGDRTAAHDVLGGAPVSALAVLATGDLVVAGRTGELMVVAEPGESPVRKAAGAVAARARVARFIAATSELPDDGDLDTDLVLTDGTTTWEPDDLTRITTASAMDPTWLRLQAAINAARTKRI